MTHPCTPGHGASLHDVRHTKHVHWRTLRHIHGLTFIGYWSTVQSQYWLTGGVGVRHTIDRCIIVMGICCIMPNAYAGSPGCKNINKVTAPTKQCVGEILLRLRIAVFPLSETATGYTTVWEVWWQYGRIVQFNRPAVTEAKLAIKWCSCRTEHQSILNDDYQILINE